MFLWSQAMADADTDISSLTEDQQLALQQFTAVTDQDLSKAVPLLKKCEWNVQVRQEPDVIHMQYS